jgi:hypothetical protein
LKLRDAIDWFEGSFSCEMGAPWRWADLGMSKPYQELRFDLDMPSLFLEEDIEHRLVSRLIHNAEAVKRDAGFRPEQRPKLFWRWADKVRIEDGEIRARFYIDGHPAYRGGPPQLGGTPKPGQVRLIA